MTKLIRDEQGGWSLDGDTLSARPEEVLDAPTREVSVSGRAGVIFRQRFSFWPLDTDTVLFRGPAGRLITNLEGFVAEPRCPYTIVTAAAVDLSTQNSSPVDCEVRSRDWKPYSFPHGLPAGLEARIDSLCLWSSEHAITNPTPPGFLLRARERSVTSLELIAAAPPHGEIADIPSWHDWLSTTERLYLRGLIPAMAVYLPAGGNRSRKTEMQLPGPVCLTSPCPNVPIAVAGGPRFQAILDSRPATEEFLHDSRAMVSSPTNALTAIAGIWATLPRPPRDPNAAAA